MTNVTRELAEFAANLRFEDIPDDVVQRTKQLILDVSGVMVRARNDAESTPSLVASMQQLGLVGGECSVFGDAKGYAASAAALVNGTLAHSLDFDDTHAEGSLHSSAPIVPATMAAAEIVGASGKDLITATVAGYEIQIRLSIALSPPDHYDRGFHPTATCGVFAATAGAGKLFGMDADGIESAFGIALSQSAGSMQFLADSAWTKRSHVGQAASNGLICASMAANGFKGPADAFEGNWGLFKSHTPKADPAKATEGLGEYWQTLRLAVKPYPSCRYTHAPMDAIIELKEEHGIEAADVEEVEVGVSETGWKIVGNPAAEKQAPASIVDGQFSMPFCGAVTLLEGKLVWDDYARHLENPATREMCKRIKTVADPWAEGEFPDNMAGVVRIRMKDGTEYEKKVVCPKGEPGNFLTDDELRTKFDGLCGPYLSGSAMDRLATSLLALEEANSVGAVMALSRPEA